MGLFTPLTEQQKLERTQQIELILQLLREAWLKNQEQRFFQLLYNMKTYQLVVEPCDGQVYAADPYQVTNQKLITLLEEYITGKTS